MILDSRCTNCGIVLGEDHGFSTLCDKCSPVEPLEIIGGTEALRPVSTPFKGDNTLALPVRPRRVVHVQSKPKEEEFDLGISLELATYADLEAYKAEIDDQLLKVRTKLDDLKIKKASKVWSDPKHFLQLERERKVLGRKHQMLAMALRVKRKQETASKQPKIDEDEVKRTDNFMHCFFNVAKRLLPEDTFTMLCKQARVDAGQ